MSELIDDLKKSLISPDGDFVKIIPIPGSEGTKMISDEDVKLIKRQTGKLDYLNFKNKTPSFIADEDMDEDEEEFNEEYDEEFDDEEEDDNDEINPRMEKILSILGIVTVIIIAFIVIFIVGKTFGFFKGSPNKDKANTEETTDTDTDTDKEDTTDVTMVNVVGLTIVEATKQLNALGLGVKTSYDFNDDYDRDYVIQQDIAEGDSVPVNTTINLVLSQGIESIDIPTVTGETEESAKKILEDLEFKVIRDYEPSDTVEAGKVISTTPASGTGAEKGATITLLISTGKDIKLATVPDIRNLSQAGAQNALSAVGLTWNTIDQAYHETVQEGLVISQSYSPGSQVEQGTAVDFVISLGRKVEVTYSYDGPVDVDGLKGTANVQLISDGSSKVLYSNNMSIPNNISVSNIKEADLNGTPNATIKITYTVVIPASTNPVDGTTIPESQNTGETYYSVVLKRSNQ